MEAATCSQYAPPPSTAGPTPAKPAKPLARRMAFCGASHPFTGFHRASRHRDETLWIEDKTSPVQTGRRRCPCTVMAGGGHHCGSLVPQHRGDHEPLAFADPGTPTARM